jgi:hypothetical protein
VDANVTIGSVADKYINAIGGKAAVQKVTSITMMLPLSSGNGYDYETDPGERRKNDDGYENDGQYSSEDRF